MSRIAVALGKAAGRPAGLALVRDEDHPWGRDLSLDADLERTSPPGREVERPQVERSTLSSAAHEVVADQTARRTGPGAIDDATELAGIDPSVYQHLTALVERVFYPVSAEPVRSVAFTGIGARSGPIAATAALVLSQHVGATVCVVDAHFEAPSLHEHFGMANTSGLAEAIATEVPLATAAHPVRPNLWLLTAGKGPRPSFASDAARARMAQFIAGFDFVLVDVEPITGGGEGIGLPPLVSGVILVVAADATRRESARRATQMLQGCGASVIGAVLTNRRFPIPDALYRRL